MKQDKRWPGGLLPNGQPKLNAANDAAVAKRKQERQTKKSK